MEKKVYIIKVKKTIHNMNVSESNSEKFWYLISFWVMVLKQRTYQLLRTCNIGMDRYKRND